MGLNVNILSLLPQRHPFVMVGELLYADEVIIRTGFLIREDNILVEDGTFTEAGLLENIAQTAAAGAGYAASREHRPIDIGYIGAIKNFEIFSLPKVNDELTTEVRIEQKIFDATIALGTVWSSKNLIAQCELKIFVNKIS